MVRAALQLVVFFVQLTVVLSGATAFGQGSASGFRSPFPDTSRAATNGPDANRQARRPVAGWPTSDVFADPPGAPKPGTALGATPRDDGPRAEMLERFELAETMAQVGDQYILKGELIGDANLLLFADFARLSKLPPDEQTQMRTALVTQRDLFLEQLLQQAIDRKLMYLEFLRSVPANLDENKLKEMNRDRQKKVNAMFHKQLAEMAEKVQQAAPEEYGRLNRQDQQMFRIALAMKGANIESPDDVRLDRLLKDNKSSLPLQQQAFMERMLGQMFLRQNANLAAEITHDQMLAHYREHLDEFRVPMRARWEQLSVLFKRTPDLDVAGEMIKDMGNMVYWGGAPLYAVAKRHSQEKNAERGGYHDWTTYNDLSISRPINDAVFSIDLNELSQIIEDEDGWHIVRVLERENAHVRPFTEAQVEIQSKLKTEMQNKAYKDYVEGLRKKTPIWRAE